MQVVVCFAKHFLEEIIEENDCPSGHFSFINDVGLNPSLTGCGARFPPPMNGYDLRVQPTVPLSPTTL